MSLFGWFFSHPLHLFAVLSPSPRGQFFGTLHPKTEKKAKGENVQHFVKNVFNW